MHEANAKQKYDAKWEYYKQKYGVDSSKGSINMT